MKSVTVLASAFLIVAMPALAAQQATVEPALDLASGVTPVTFGDQLPQAAGAPPTPRHTGIKAMIRGLGRDFKELPSKENLYWALGGGGMALAVHPADEYVNEHITGNRLADDIFKPGQVIGIVVPWAGSAAIYAWGRLKDQPKISHVGTDLLQSEIVAYTLTTGLKYATHRLRPDESSYTSFPSGHASSTFAFATALERHLGWRYAVPAYIFASYVAVSRLPANRHWLSDVVFGATVGVIAGRTVTSREAQPYPVAVNPVPGGAMVTYSPARFNRRP